MPPQMVASWRHAGAERYEVMVDFSDAGRRQGRAAQRQHENNRDFLHTGKVMQFRVTWEADGPRWTPS